MNSARRLRKKSFFGGGGGKTAQIFEITKFAGVSRWIFTALITLYGYENNNYCWMFLFGNL